MKAKHRDVACYSIILVAAAIIGIQLTSPGSVSGQEEEQNIVSMGQNGQNAQNEPGVFPRIAGVADSAEVVNSADVTDSADVGKRNIDVDVGDSGDTSSTGGNGAADVGSRGDTSNAKNGAAGVGKDGADGETVNADGVDGVDGFAIQLEESIP
jgi:hypothetical protein